MSDIAAKILVVDDDLFTAELTGMVIEMVGYEAVIAEGGMDALEKLAGDSEIRAVLSDMNMPFMDGEQLFSEMRDRGFRQPFVLLTGNDAVSLRSAYPDMDAVMTKDENLQDNLPGVLQELLMRG